MKVSQRKNGENGLTADSGGARPMVLIFMQAGGNRSLLADTLAEQYRVEATTDPDRLELEFDCCILDQRAIERVEEPLQRRVEAEEAFLPIVLLVRENERSVGGSKYWNTVDDIIDIPVDRNVLIARIENLVARRHTSVELARQNERLADFASVVSHDLRNPLGVAEGRLELVKETFDSEHLDALSGALDRMRALIDDLLVLAREGDAVSEPESISLGGFVEECWGNIDTKNANLVVDSQATIQGSPRQLRQLFENLLRNAIEHGGESVTIRIGAVDDGFYVEDDGPGIPVEHRGVVLESGVTSHDSGTGLGLAIVRQIADAHGWAVTVGESETGGARFEFAGVDSG